MQQNMKFVVATHSFLLALEVDPAWHVVNHALLSSGYHYGIGLLPDTVQHHNVSHFVAYRGGNTLKEQNDRKLISFKNSPSWEQESATVLGEGFEDIHQVICANNGIYIANTGHNSIVYLADDASQQEYFFGNLTHDHNHVNSIFSYGEVLLVMLHNKAHKETELAMLRHDRAKGFAFATTLSLWNIGCHNIYVEDQFLYYNASREQQIVVVDIPRNQIAHKIQLDGHTKGMSVVGNHMIVGVSEHTVRDLRSTSKGHLVVIDKESLTQITTIDINFPDLPHPVGNINEVRCISDKDLAHTVNPQPAVDLSKLTLARSSRLRHLAFQATTIALKPVRRMKHKVMELRS